MSPGLQLELHWWRKPGVPAQKELFFYGLCFGLFTVSICRVCVIDAYKHLREAVETRISADEKKLRGDE